MSDQPPETPTGIADDKDAAGKTTDAASTADDREETTRILDALRNNDFLAGLVDARDVSLIYIDRHQVNTYLGADPEGASPLPRADTRQERAPTTRIGDLVVNPISRWEAARLAQVFVDPPRLAAAEAKLREHGLLVLHGPAGTGKRAAALYLLGRLAFGPTPTRLYELNPDLDLADLRPDALPPDTGLFLECSRLALARLSRFQLETLQHALGPGQAGRGNNALVIVTDARPASVPGALAQSWLLDWPDVAAAQRLVVVKHLHHGLGRTDDDPQPVRQSVHAGTQQAGGNQGYDDDQASEFDPVTMRLNAVMDDPALTPLLAAPMAMAQLAELATALLPVVHDARPLEQALAQLERFVDADVAGWFEDGDHDLDLKALLIAAAAFNGALADEVEGAGASLATRLRPEEAPVSTPSATASRNGTQHGGPLYGGPQQSGVPQDPFATSRTRTRRFNAIQADLVETTLKGNHYGETTARTLQLRNPAWQKAVLLHVWREYTDVRGALLAWLLDYASLGNHRQRVRAAAATGALARENFPHIESVVLRRWAGSPDPNERRAAGQVLGITMWDARHSAATAGLLHHWASLKQNPRHLWTAATAYAGLAGLRYPQQTLDDLARIAARTIDVSQLLLPFFQAVANLYVTADTMPERRAMVLDALVEWSELPRRHTDDDYARARAALLAFWVLLWPERDLPGWRTLLADIGVPGSHQAQAVALMRRSFNFRQGDRMADRDLHPRKLARMRLVALMEQVGHEHDPEQTEYLIGLITALTRTCAESGPMGWEELRRLDHYARQWRSDDGNVRDLFALLML